MEIIRFESAVIARTLEGDVVFALFDGSVDDRTRQSRLATMLICRTEVVQALRSALGSALQPLD